MRFGLLGPLEVVGEDGARRDPAAARQRRLLLALLVWRDEPVSADRLVDAVWSDAELPRDPVGALRTYVTRLRSALEPERVGRRPQVLVGGPDHYRLRLDGHELDAADFEQDLARGTAALDHGAGQALPWLDRALTRWRGPALVEVADEAWAIPEVVRLDELRLVAQEHRFACLVETSGDHPVVSELERHVREHPLRERPHGLLMVALDRCGRTADATETFRDFRRRLVEETGLDPSPDLVQLHERLLGDSSSSVLIGTAGTGTWNKLPAARTKLIGRVRDLDVVSRLRSSARIVTLTGAGGVGKTRLAVEVADVERDAGGRVAFVDLGSVTSGDDVVDACFAALRLPAIARAGAVEGLIRVMAARPALVVLDNCEHVLDVVADLVDRLTRDGPELTVLATSREPIGLDGEQVYRLPSLDPEAGVTLFRDRARAVAGTRAFGSSTLGVVQEVCHRLDGIPLAIELAASQTAHLPLSEIAERLDERFWMLTGSRRALPRHQTLQATIDWSYQLLDAREQRLLRAASVFVDGFDAPALAAVVDCDPWETVDGLGSLVHKSLVEADQGENRARYRLLETVRLYGLARLAEAGEADPLRRAHADHFLGRALTHEPRLDDLPPAIGGSMCRLRLSPLASHEDPDLANHLAALDWLDRAGDLAGLGRLAARLTTVLGCRGFLDHDRRYLGRDDVAEALSDRAERAMYLAATALHAAYFADWTEELRFGEAALEAAPDPATRAVAAALSLQASLGLRPDRVPALAAVARRDLPSDATYTRLLVRGMETLHVLLRGPLDEAAERLEAHARAGDVFAAAEQLVVLHLLGDDERLAGVGMPAGADTEHQLLWGYRWPFANALAAAAAGNHDEAARRLLQAAERVASCPVPLLDRDLLVGCAVLAHHADEPREAWRLLAAAGGRARSPATFVLYGHYRWLVEGLLGDGEAERILEVMRDLDVRDVLDSELARLRVVTEAEDVGTPPLTEPTPAGSTGAAGEVISTFGREPARRASGCRSGRAWGSTASAPERG